MISEAVAACISDPVNKISAARVDVNLGVSVNPGKFKQLVALTGRVISSIIQPLALIGQFNLFAGFLVFLPYI